LAATRHTLGKGIEGKGVTGAGDAEARASAGGWNGTTWTDGDSSLGVSVGLLDDPSRQWQGALQIDFERAGSLGIYGGPQSGKTTFLCAILAALARSHSPADVVYYLIDFDRRLLNQFAALPHTGGVVNADEPERVRWLLTYLRSLLERRRRELERSATISYA